MQYNVMVWDFNHDALEPYDIMPYLRRVWDEEKEREFKVWGAGGENKDRMPETFDEFKQFINDVCQYQFWSRCQYEMITHGWPKHNNEHKLDVYEQISYNIDVVTKIFMEEINNEKD